MKDQIPRATVARLPLYLRCLDELPSSQETVSSEQIAAWARVNSAKVRKDLSFMGSYGTRGVGYEVNRLQHQIRRVLGLTHDWAVAIVGVGNLGSALADYRGFGERGFAIAGLFDSDPEKIGSAINGFVVESIDDLDAAIVERHIAIGIITTPAAAAQEVAERLAAAGVRSILNFAPTVLHLPDDVELRRVDLSTELQILTHYLQRRNGFDDED